jgi:tripartite-type tricarboxylate transporter receptor subunit TctC
MIWKTVLTLGCLLVGLILTDARADAAYPNRPIRVVLPFGAGGVADITARLVTEKMGDKLGQRFVIENLPGAGGGLAAQRVATAPADGYSLALFSNGTAVSVPLFKSLPFDPLKDFVPISTMGQFDFVLAANGASGYRALGDFIKAAQARPGGLNIGTINIGSTQHLSGLLFATEAKIKVVMVPFRATPDAMVGLLRNDVNLVIDSYASLKAGLDDKRLTPLATTGATRSELLPQVAAVAEQGVHGFDVTSWNALFARAGTPAEIVTRLNRTMVEVLADDGLRRRLLELGIEAKSSTPEALARRLADDIARWSAVIEAAGVPKQ